MSRDWPHAPAPLRLAPHALLAALAAGLALATRWSPSVPGTAAVAAILVAIAALLIARGRARSSLGALLALCVVAGLAWGGARIGATAPPALALPAEVFGTVVLDTSPTPGDGGGMRARAVVERMATPGGRGPRAGVRILVDLPRGRGDPPALGARLQVVGRLTDAARRDAPDWWRAYLARQGIAARLRPRSFRVVGRRGGLAGVRDRLRLWAGGAAGAGLGGDTRALVRGMAIGGGAGLSEAGAQDFRDAGLWHLLAVSGQNVTVVALSALLALRALGVPRRAAAGAAAALLVGYCLLCDGGASVARAGVVGALGVLAELRSAARDRWYLLMAALVGLLAVQPLWIGDPGLHLSFAAVLGLFLIAPPLAAWGRGWLPGRLADLAALAGGAGLATAPVMVWHFGRLSLVGVLLNVVAVPVAGPVVVLALGGIVAGLLLPPLALALTWVAGAGAAVLLAAAHAAAALPGAAVDLPAATALPLAVAAAAPPLVAAWLRRPRASPTRRPPWRPVAAVALVGTAAVVALTARRDPPPSWPAVPALTVLDVGQGDAVLVRGPDGSAALIDGGPSGAPPPVLAALRRQGVRRLAAVVLTHGSLDHVGGLPAVLAALPVGVVLRPPMAGVPPAARAALDAARRRGVPVRTVAAGAVLRVGAWRLRILSPAGPPPSDADPNVGSLVALASSGALDALLTADAESGVLSRLPLPPIEVLKVSHHGSADAGLPDLLRRLRPREAVVSVGRGNPYGHPAAATEAALRAAGAGEWRTDLAGDVTVSAAPAGLSVLTDRER